MATWGAVLATGFGYQLATVATTWPPSPFAENGAISTFLALSGYQWLPRGYRGHPKWLPLAPPYKGGGGHGSQRLRVAGQRQDQIKIETEPQRRCLPYSLGRRWRHVLPPLSLPTPSIPPRLAMA